jgi:hypothetical protein
MRSIKQLNATTLLFLTAVGCLIAVNYSLPFPDISDFHGLARICLLMDENIKYCVNNNWGFAHPLSCWLLTKTTGDLLISQRSLNALFTMLYVMLLLRMVHFFLGRLTGKSVGCLILFICSPWILDAALSAHMDIIPITLVFTAVFLITHRKGRAVYIAAGVMAGASYWFRFHFLPMSLSFPLLAFALANERKERIRGLLTTTAGVIAAIAIPHILCMLAYGVFGISNERFVLAYALGAVDWTYESAVRLSQMTTAELFRSFDPLWFILSYGYHFIISGLFPLMLIVVISFRNYFHEKRETFHGFLAGSDPYRAMILIALWAGITMIPFSLVRGFTYRLEAAFVLFVIPVVARTIADASKSTALITLALFISMMTMQHLRFWQGFLAEKTAVVDIKRNVERTIPDAILKNRPGSIIICFVNYYNPYNKYHLCNPMVVSGWGARFGPFIDRFGLLNLTDPFDSDIYKKAEYLVLPTHRDADVFSYSGELITRNLKLFEDENVIILQREPTE